MSMQAPLCLCEDLTYQVLLRYNQCAVCYNNLCRVMALGSTQCRDVTTYPGMSDWQRPAHPVEMPATAICVR